MVYSCLGMESLLQKLANYHLLNYLIPGYVFLWLVGRLLRQDFFPPDLIQIATISYVAGVIIATLGRWLTEPFLQAIRTREQTTYDDFVVAESRDPKLTTMSEAGDMFAALATSIALSIAVYLVMLTFPGFLDHPVAVVLILTAICGVLIAAYCRRMKVISRRVRSVIIGKDSVVVSKEVIR